MSFRDLFVFGVFALLVFRIPAHPYIGAIAWVVFSVMNPHRLAWGSAFDFPFAQYIALLTIAGLLFTKDHVKLKGTGLMFLLAGFFIWMAISTAFAFYPEQSFTYLQQIFKIFLMTAVLLAVLHTRRHVELLIWALVISLGFYGTKGGIFTIVGGGQFIVNGPDGSLMEGNNALGVGLVVVIPLMLYLFQHSKSRLVRIGLVGAAGLCAISVLGSYSRGALLAIGAMGLLLWIRSAHKVAILGSVIAFVLIAIPAMPDNWAARMLSIQDYENENSAAFRLIAWETAYNVAKDRFPFAGGFHWESSEISARYSPDPSLSMVAHSNYFQVLGALGFVGLAFYLAFWALVWRQCNRLRSMSRGNPEIEWAYSLASMIQVGLVGYLVGGAFIDTAFWDLAYYLFAAVAVTQYVVDAYVRYSSPTASSSTLVALIETKEGSLGRKLHGSRKA